MDKNCYKILCVIGTRPEGIKMAPVVLALKAEPWAKVRILSTAQHREMLDQVLTLFDIKPDIDLDLMQNDQTLAQLTGRLAIRIDEIFAAEKPDMVLAQGDTTTVMMAALIAFYQRIPFGHVEAGLRTGNRYFPFPEEMNRVVTGYLSHLHFAPTLSSCNNLLKEGVPETAIQITGNTVIDALLYQAKHPVNLDQNLNSERRLVLLTAHRRENFGEPFQDICRAMLYLVQRHPDIEILYPVHPNPNIEQTARRILGNHPQIILTAPLDYRTFVTVMQRAYLILTDSGGVQEEAPALGKPVLVLRRETERPEAVDAGVVQLVGPSYPDIIAAADELLLNPQAYAAMARGVSPYGDGQAAARIVSAIARYLGISQERVQVVDPGPWTQLKSLNCV